MKEQKIANVFSDFYEAFHFLRSHKVFAGRYLELLVMKAVKVDPDTNCISNDSSQNTVTRVCFEAYPDGYHDCNLDCMGATYEEVTIMLANIVLAHYGKGQLSESNMQTIPLPRISRI